jgi:hypothetical protein
LRQGRDYKRGSCHYQQGSLDKTTPKRTIITVRNCRLHIFSCIPHAVYDNTTRGIKRIDKTHVALTNLQAHWQLQRMIDIPTPS